MNSEFGTTSPDLRSPLLPASPTTSSEAVASDACQLAFNSISELMSLMIHDLANPLQSLTMRLELSSEPDQPVDVDELLRTSEEVGSLLNNISGFFYRNHATVPCQLRACLARARDTMAQRLANRGITWESSWLDLPNIPHSCILVELVLLRCLILIGYQPRQGQRPALSLRSTPILLHPYQAQRPVDLRIQLELMDQNQVPTQILSSEKADSFQALMQRLGPGFGCSRLAKGRVQLDFRLPCPPSR